MDEKLDIVTIGESLIELSSDISLKQTTSLDKYYGGDTLATAVTASRLGAKVGYITRVGCDNFKEFLLDSWQSEGLDISQVKLTKDKNGIYLLARPEGKPKEISYYRKKTAATKISIDDIKENYIANTKVFYSTGITQSLSLSAKEAVKKTYLIAQNNSIITAYDPNYMPFLETPTEARELFDDVISNVNILFLNAVTDISNLFEISSIEKAIKDLWDLGISTVIIKSPKESGIYTGYNGEISFFKYLKKEVIDTTCSGDAFNGAFLYAITAGFTPFEATKLATVTANLQATKIGAIKSIPTKKEVYDEYEKL